MVMNEVGITGRMSANVCRCCKVQGNRALLYLSVVIFVLCQLLPISNTFHVHLQKKQSSSWLVHTDEGVLKMSMVVSTDTVPSNRNRPSQSNWNNANEVNTGAAKSSVEYELRGAIAKRQWANAKEILSNLSKCNLANGRNVVFVIAETCRRNQDFDQIVPLLQSIPNGILSFAEDDIMTVVNECADTNKMRVILPLIAFVFQQEEKMHLTPKLLAVLAKGKSYVYLCNA